MQKNILFTLKYCCCIYLLFFTWIYSAAQTTVGDKKVSASAVNAATKPLLYSSAGSGDLFDTRIRYIENIGQYGTTLSSYDYMGNILYGYEGLNMPVLFTQKGIVYLQRKLKKLSSREIEKLERKGMSEAEIKEKVLPVDRTVTMEWANANPNPEIIAEDLSGGYHTYGMLQGRARAFKKIIYKEIYPGIDAEYSFSSASKQGYEYSLLVKPGADISVIKMKYRGDVSKLKTDAGGNLIISSDIDDVIQSVPVCFYADDKNDRINIAFEITGKGVGFKTGGNYDSNKTIIIDPFVTSTSSLTGQYASAAKDIDFDYQGNVYVSGGGDASVQKMAKFNAAGLLQWTFSGALTLPIWNFGGSEGGWVVEKTSGNIYLGQGLAGSGFKVIRLTTAGVYDNYITNANLNFGENWKMLWNCNGGIPKMLIAGGGGSANNELAILSPPLVDPSTSNISGLSGGHNDISDIIIDPVSNDMYTIFSTSVLSPSVDSKIYKHTPPYAPANIAWSNFSGCFTIKEPYNRPYFGGGLDNSTNCLALNADYLFYWDGKTLKAFNKKTGVETGTAVVLPSTALMQGGIFADECNNVFIGYTNGTIKVYKFNGVTFDDAAAADINITGFSTNSVYDIAYDHGRNLIYACGAGFVTAIDVSQYCALPVYTVTVATNLTTMSATASLSPAPSAGSTVTYALYDGTTFISSNSTGVFTGLTLNVTYTIKVVINEACGGTQAIKDFKLAGLPPNTKTSIYVPNAFTPNGDIDNDILKAIVTGVQEFHYFSIYNRYGELVFSTKDPAIGWDGTFKGKKQNAGTFVWMLEAIDATGNITRLKGTTILIR
ncbi:T9SS type B sorting domain-containing protein [Ferruginibacter sp. SUN106]|uniref:DUF7948 domain-containing protein n=1 Tax=Ferruginibacter sp. SUN106 TaxID=2978348 RepID=UPI003D369438